MTEKRLAACQRVIGYYFSNPRLLETALTHSSLRAPDRECNERLEFLGDSILGLVITEELYHLLPDQGEGELTRIKSAVVSRSALLDASLRLGLPQYAEFARGVGKRDHLPASVVANLVESLIGAIYLDAGYYPAREFVLRHLGTAIDDELHDRGAKNYKSLLQHEVQQSVGITPTYRTLEADGPDHAKEFVVAAIIRGQEWGRATGTTKKDAEQEAARKALEAWQRRGRGRRRRRRRRPNGAPGTKEAPAEVEDAAASPAEEPAPSPVEEPAPSPAEEPSPSPVEEPSPSPVEGAAPAPEADAPAPVEPPPSARPPRRRRTRPEPRRRARPPVPQESAADAPAPPPAARRPATRRPRRAEEPAPSPAAEGAPPPADEPPKTPPRRRRPAAAETGAEPAPPVEAAVEGFAAGIDLEPRAAPPAAPAKVKGVEVKAPARRAAPRTEGASEDDADFTSGILAD